MAKEVIKKNENFGILSKEKLLDFIESKELIIKPILENSQIGAISIDLRVGTDFLALNQGRDEFIDTTSNKSSNRPIKSHFSESRRKIGDSFLLHPNQTILMSSLEYLKLPNNVYADLNLRSSYNRLGLVLSSIIQPGYCGCASIELVNTSNTTIKILSGARLFQARFYQINNTTNYFDSSRKYSCQVRPVSSKANEDNEIEKLKSLTD